LNNIVHTGSSLKITRIGILPVEFRIRKCPHMVPARMVGHPVYNDFKTHTMRLFNKIFKIFQGAKFRVYRSVIRGSILAAQAAFLVFLCDGSDWHKPEGFHTHILQPGKLCRKCFEGTFRSVLTQVYFVNIGSVFPRTWYSHWKWNQVVIYSCFPQTLLSLCNVLHKSNN